jgi:hypothetical protein
VVSHRIADRLDTNLHVTLLARTDPGTPTGTAHLVRPQITLTDTQPEVVL